MKTLEPVTFEQKDGVGWIRMNRPKELNAFNIAMGKDLCAAANHCGAEKSIRAVVLTGTGRAFCAGGDVQEMNRRLQEEGRADLFLRELTVLLHAFVAEIVRMQKPVIAAVNGTAAGAGMSMSLACDLGLFESLESQMENERQGIITSALCEEFREAITAFVGKKKPDFPSVG